MEENRLFRFPRPAWLTNTNTRTFGVYTAGALVGSPLCTHDACAQSNASV